MKKILFALFSATILLGCAFHVFSVELPFNDVDSFSWYRSAVETVYSEGIMEGIGNSRFAPMQPMSRAELVTVMYRLSGENTENLSGSLSFTDTDSSAWYSDSVKWAVEKGLVTGYTDGSFKPNAPIQRQELAKITVLFLESKGVLTNINSSVSFADRLSFPEWSREYIEKLGTCGLMIGDEKGNFNPNSNTSRAEIATLVTRILPLLSSTSLLDVVKDGKFTYTVVYDDSDSILSGIIEDFLYDMRFEKGLKINGVKASEAKDDYGREIVFGNVRDSAEMPYRDLAPSGDFLIRHVEDDIILCTNDSQLYSYLFKVFEVKVLSFLENQDLKIPEKIDFQFSKSNITHLSRAEYAIANQAVNAVDVYDFFHLKEFTSSDGSVIKYRFFVPFDYSPDKKYPVLLSLHGMGENLVDESKGSTSTLLCMRNMFNLENTPVTEAIIICPQGAQSSLAVELVEHIASNYSTDPDRYYLMGLSMGGAGTWSTIQEYPDYFAAAMPICGYGSIKDPTVLVNVPLYVVHGVDDTTVGVGSSRMLVEAIREAGSKVIHYEEPEGYGHSSWHYATKKIEIVKWMFDQRLSAR
ncbi:MAG: S-layer homology domain-containing protein [Clostridia bacterium]|nr:S-layer homology domain-containing protein [Clostridia bacterium]